MRFNGPTMKRCQGKHERTNMDVAGLLERMDSRRAGGGDGVRLDRTADAGKNKRADQMTGPLAKHTPGGVLSASPRSDMRSICNFTPRVNPGRCVQAKTLPLAMGQNPNLRNRVEPFTENVPRNRDIVAGKNPLNIYIIFKLAEGHSNGPSTLIGCRASTTKSTTWSTA